ncbi:MULTISPECIES: DUF2637 domain-containing protein [Streptacidiphilus]|uniref:DUF2637 domain-containing protein n=1 Tax=Streptacidiphilus cavernicola TaxID=3342716 RepID=A0ABV6UWA3_9ACTN|nr:DUF2637 domain-containing protein [Streptacidiphilus jeojiense]
MNNSEFYEERRKDRAAAFELELAQKAAEREAEREAEANRREQERQDRAERDEAQRRARREADREKTRRRTERQSARAAGFARLRAQGDTVAALVVMVCSAGPALYFQLHALSDAGLPVMIAVALAVMLESGAGVATIAGERARREGRPTLPFRLAMWGAAGIAATINYSHAPGPEGGWLAWVLALASLGSVAFWELRGIGRHKSKSSRTKAQRREDRRRRRHDRKRRRRFRAVYRRYVDLMTAAPYGTLPTETAWRSAWYDVHRSDLGITAAVLAARVAADKALSEAVAGSEMSPEAVAVELLLAELFGPGEDEDGTGGGRSNGGPNLSPTGGPRGPKTLGRKGKRVSGRTAAKTPLKPLDEADLDKVRDLAAALRDVTKLSVANVRSAVGGGSTEYLIRLRDAVKNERAAR